MAKNKYSNDLIRAFDRVRITLESMVDAPDVDQDVLDEALWHAGCALGLAARAVDEQQVSDYIDSLE